MSEIGKNLNRLAAKFYRHFSFRDLKLRKYIHIYLRNKMDTYFFMRISYLID